MTNSTPVQARRVEHTGAMPLVIRARIAGSVLVGLAACWFVLWRQLRPPDPGGAVSLAVLDHPAVVVAVMFVVAVVVAVMATFISAQHARFVAPVAVPAGLILAAIRSGPITTLFRLPDETAGQLFPALAVETVVYALLVYLAWGVTLALSAGTGRLLGNASTPPDDPSTASPGATWSQSLLCLVACCLTACVLLMITAQGDATGQAVFACAVSFYLGALAAHQLIPVRDPAWCFSAAPIVGVVAYVLFAPGQLPSPVVAPANTIAPRLLCNILPIEFVAVGCTAAMAGYWSSARIFYARKLRAAGQ